MKVSHILGLSELPGRPPFSGAENHVMTLLPALRQQGVEVELIAPTYGIGPQMVQRLRSLRAQGVVVTLIAYRRRRWAYGGSRKLDLTRRLGNLLHQRHDHIIHIHLDFFSPVVAAGLARCPAVVQSIHCADPWQAQAGGRIWLQVVNRVVDHSIAISEHVRHYYCRVAGCPPARVSTVYYGLDLPPTPEPPAAIRQRYGIPPDRFVVGFVGRLARQKNLPLLINALAHLPAVHGVIVGTGPQQDALHALAAKLGVSNVQFLGHQPDASRLMPAFDLFCLPSSYEGLGLVLVEAMLQRVPTASSHISAMPEILGHGQYGLLFEPDRVAHLVETIRFAQHHPAAMHALAERAYAYARQTFSIAAMVRGTLDVYERCACERAGGLGWNG